MGDESGRSRSTEEKTRTLEKHKGAAPHFLDAIVTRRQGWGAALFTHFVKGAGFLLRTLRTQPGGIFRAALDPARTSWSTMPAAILFHGARAWSKAERSFKIEAA
jgi:hypothetical protein